jgi:hypothetical protein
MAAAEAGVKRWREAFDLIELAFYFMRYTLDVLLDTI